MKQYKKVLPVLALLIVLSVIYYLNKKTTPSLKQIESEIEFDPMKPVDGTAPHLADLNEYTNFTFKLEYEICNKILEDSNMDSTNGSEDRRICLMIIKQNTEIPEILVGNKLTFESLERLEQTKKIEIDKNKSRQCLELLIQNITYLFQSQNFELTREISDFFRSNTLCQEAYIIKLAKGI